MTANAEPDPRCVIACTSPCPWASCVIPVAQHLNDLVGDLIDIDLIAARTR